MEIVGFNQALWAAADRGARMKSSTLYHTGIEFVEWAEGNKLILDLRGSRSGKSGEGTEERVGYHLDRHTVTKESRKRQRTSRILKQGLRASP